MISDEDHNTDGKPSHHDTRRKGSMCVVVVCLGLLNTILLLTAVVIGIYCGKVSEESSSLQVPAQALIIEVEQLQIIQSEAMKALKEAEQALEKELKIHQQLKMQLEKNKTVSDRLQRQIETLRMETQTLLSNSFIARTSCGRCPPGWFLSYRSCYFHSRSASSPPRNWTDSRADCISRGADLAVISDWDEQVHLFDKMPKLEPMNRNTWESFKGVWIGLSDIQTEGTWVWINNVTHVNQGYWIYRQPDNYGPQGQDCVALMNMDSPVQTWFDANCKERYEWLCEKQTN